MTTLIQNEQKRQKIMARMREHLVPVLEHCRGGWVGLFLQGSQNYNLDYEGSDIDTKVIMLPSFSDFVLNAKPLSTTHIMENNEHVDFKDIKYGNFRLIRSVPGRRRRQANHPAL